jgi:hypothetical protein
MSSSRRPDRDLVRVHPNHAVKNGRRQPVEAAGRRSGRVVAQPVELRTVSAVLEPHRRLAVDDPLAEVCASRHERDRGSWGVRHHVGGQVGKRRDAPGSNILHRSQAHPSRPWRVGGPQDRYESPGQCHGDRERTHDHPETPALRWGRSRCHRVHRPSGNPRTQAIPRRQRMAWARRRTSSGPRSSSSTTMTASAPASSNARRCDRGSRQSSWTQS